MFDERSFDKRSLDQRSWLISTLLTAKRYVIRLASVVVTKVREISNL